MSRRAFYREQRDADGNVVAWWWSAGRPTLWQRVRLRLWVRRLGDDWQEVGYTTDDGVETR